MTSFKNFTRQKSEDALSNNLHTYIFASRRCFWFPSSSRGWGVCCCRGSISHSCCCHHSSRETLHLCDHQQRLQVMVFWSVAISIVHTFIHTDNPFNKIKTRMRTLFENRYFILQYKDWTVFCETLLSQSLTKKRTERLHTINNESLYKLLFFCCQIINQNFTSNLRVDFKVCLQSNNIFLLFI